MEQLLRDTPSTLGREFILMRSNAILMRQAVLSVDHETLAEFGFGEDWRSLLQGWPPFHYRTDKS